METTILSATRALTLTGGGDSHVLTFDPPLKEAGNYYELTDDERYRMKMAIAAYRIANGSAMALATHAQTMRDIHGPDPFTPGGVVAGYRSPYKLA